MSTELIKIFDWDEIADFIMDYLSDEEVLNLKLVNKDLNNIMQRHKRCTHIYARNSTSKDLSDTFNNCNYNYNQLTIGHNFRISPNTNLDFLSCVTYVKFKKLDDIQIIVQNCKSLTHVNLDMFGFSMVPPIFFDLLSDNRNVIFHTLKKMEISQFHLSNFPKKKKFIKLFPVLEEFIVDNLVIDKSFEKIKEIALINETYKNFFKFNTCKFHFDNFSYAENKMKIWKFIKIYRKSNICDLFFYKENLTTLNFLEDFINFKLNVEVILPTKLPITIFPYIIKYISRYDKNLNDFQYMVNLQTLILRTSENCFFSHEPIKTQSIKNFIIYVEHKILCNLCLNSIISSFNKDIKRIIINNFKYKQPQILDAFKSKNLHFTCKNFDYRI